MKDVLKKYGKELIILFSIIFIGFGIGFFVVKDNLFEKDKVEEKDNNKEENESEEIKEQDNLKEQSKPLLYKVTKEGTDTTMYLFGSIHVADERAYPMPDVVMDAYNNSDYLAVEFDLITYSKDYKAQVDSLKTLVLQDGTLVKDHLSEETYELMVKYLKENKLYSSMYDYYKPAIHYSLISSFQAEQGGLDSNLGIDMYFLEKAHDEKKGILEVESASSQYEMLGSLPDKLFDFMILSSIINEKAMVKDNVDLYEAWLEGDASYIINALESSDNEILKNFDSYREIIELVEQYNKALIDDRNVAMTQKAIEYFNEGKNVFFVVGLAHIVGENAIANNLKENGYIVEVVEY